MGTAFPRAPPQNDPGHCNVCNLRRIADRPIYAYARTANQRPRLSAADLQSYRTYGSIDLTVVENSYTSLCT